MLKLNSAGSLRYIADSYEILRLEQLMSRNRMVRWRAQACRRQQIHSWKQDKQLDTWEEDFQSVQRWHRTDLTFELFDRRVRVVDAGVK